MINYSLLVSWAFRLGLVFVDLLTLTWFTKPSTLPDPGACLLWAFEANIWISNSSNKLQSSFVFGLGMHTRV